jgi:hypothetical protein
LAFQISNFEWKSLKKLVPKAGYTVQGNRLTFKVGKIFGEKPHIAFLELVEGS